jgi:hypothetical protein
VLPVLQIQSMHELAWAAAFGGATIALPLLLVVSQLVRQGQPHSVETELVASGSLGRYGTGMADMIYAYCGQVIFVELHSEMQAPQDFRRANRGACSCSTAHC